MDLVVAALGGPADHTAAEGTEIRADRNSEFAWRTASSIWIALKYLLAQEHVYV
jgi:hypothetical protein